MKIILSFIFFKKFILSFINVVIHKLCDSGTVILNTSCTSKRFWLDFIFIRIWNILRVSYCVSSKSSWEFIRKKIFRNHLRVPSANHPEFPSGSPSGVTYKMEIPSEVFLEIFSRIPPDVSSSGISKESAPETH